MKILSLTVICTVFMHGLTNAEPKQTNAASSVTTRFEAEKGFVEGVSSHLTDNTIFIDNSQECSDGKCVGFFGRVGNSVTFNIDSTASTTTQLAFAISSCTTIDLLLNTTLEVIVDGVAFSFNESTLPACVGNQYFNFSEFTISNVALKETSSIVIRNLTDYPLNIDYLDITHDSVETLTWHEGGNVDPILPVDGTKYSFEAENCEVIGKSSHAGGLDTFIDNSDLCSGGHCLSFLGTSGIQIRWGITANKNVQNVKLNLKICLCCGGQSTSFLSLMINNKPVAWETSTLPGLVGANYYDFVDCVSFSFTLNEGVNSFELINLNGSGFNLDILEYKNITDDTVALTFGEYQEIVPVAEKHCFEAEQFEVVGQSSHPTDPTLFIDNSDLCSGGHCLGFLGKSGVKIRWNIATNTKVDNVKLNIRVCLCDSRALNPEFLVLKINNKVVGWTTEMLPGLVGANYFAFVDCYSESFNLNEGFNNFEIENTTNTPFNFDLAKIEGIDDDSVELTLGDYIEDKAPVINNLKVLEEERTTNKTLTISYEVTDDFTSVENLVITVNVYYEFGTDDHEKLDVEENKFTPKKLGEYTILVLARDELENTGRSEIKITIDKEGVIDFIPGEQQFKLNETQVSSIVLLGSVVVVASLFVVVVVLNGKKRKELM